MEGRNPNAFCTLTSCARCSRQWIPPPPIIYPRRNPLVEAYALTENPCLPPGRCPPCKDPVPKFRMLREFDACDIDKMKEISKTQRRRDDPQDCYQSRCLQPNLELALIDSNYGGNVMLESDPPYKGRWKEVKPRTNILAGFFNPDDNKTYTERYAERCDPAYVNCSPEMPEYPCRGVINFPCRRWVSKEEECRECFPADCKNSNEACSYMTPQYLDEFKRRKEKWAEEDWEKMYNQMEREKRAHEEYMGCYACPCAAGRCSENMGCYHPTKSTG